jgi:putative ABC transport system ATP-binding protein
MSEELAVRVRALRKEFDGGAVVALAGADLDVRVGEWVAITGPSGCGKSTLLHLVAALDRPSSGRIEVLGRDISELRGHGAAYRRSTVGLVFQLHNLLPQLTAEQNVEVAMLGTLDRRARRLRARRLLTDVDLADPEQWRRPPTKLSGGERQRVAIARALANDPPLLLADEPTGSIDSVGVHRVIELLARLRADRPALTIVMVTHDPRVAAAADRSIAMSDGIVLTPDASDDPALTATALRS